MSQLTEILWYCLAVLVAGMAMIGLAGWHRSGRQPTGTMRLQRAELRTGATARRDHQPA